MHLKERLYKEFTHIANRWYVENKKEYRDRAFVEKWKYNKLCKTSMLRWAGHVARLGYYWIQRRILGENFSGKKRGKNQETDGEMR